MRKEFNKGISAMELIVTISIFAIITTIVLFDYPKFSSRISLERTAQEIALSLHESRMYGIGVKQIGGNIPDFGTGVHFSLSGGGRSFFIFGDSNKNNKYDEGEIKVSTFNITTSDFISKICVSYSSITSCDHNWVDIVFLRPAPSVVIAAENVSNIFKAEITVQSPMSSDTYKTITVWTTGQVSIR